MNAPASVPNEVMGEPLTANTDVGKVSATLLTVPVPFTNTRKLSLYVYPAPTGALSWIM